MGSLRFHRKIREWQMVLYLVIMLSFILSSHSHLAMPSFTAMVEEFPKRRRTSSFRQLRDTLKASAADRENTLRQDLIKNDNMREHPIRTDEWLIKFHIPLFCRIFSAINIFTSSSQYTNSLHPLRLLPLPPSSHLHKSSCRQQRIKFHSNGHVLVVEDHSTRTTKIGKWRLDTSSILWEIPVRMGCSQDGDVRRLMQVQYVADIHLNKFGNQPKMFRGIITRDRSYNSFLPLHLFRPVIATFTAEGVGQDTADVSYRKRGTGLWHKSQ